MSNEEVRNMVLNSIINLSENICARNIVERARAIWQRTGFAIDDITCIVAFFNE